MQPKGANRSATAVLAGVCGALLLALIVASSGVVFAVGEPFRTLHKDSEPPTPGEIKAPPGAPDLNDPWWLTAGLWLIYAAVVSVLLYLAYRLLRWLLRQRRPGRAETGQPMPTVVQAVLEDAPEQLAVLHSGTPTNAIIRCWQRLEDAIAGADHPALPWETPAEVVTGVLGAFGIEPGPIEELAALYREARFSRHPLDEAARHQAIRALHQVHDALAGLQPVESGTR